MTRLTQVGSVSWPAWPGSVVLGGVVASVGALWAVIGPAGLGGSLFYLATRGPSMLPRFHTGDLAVVRPERSYHVGEIVLYRYPKLGLILHRIVGVSDGRFLMKGDHNDYIDPYHPRSSDIVGRLWLHVHSVGLVLSWFHQPAASAAVAVALGTWFFIMPRINGESKRRGSESGAGVDARGSRYGSARSLPLALLGPSGMALGSAVALLCFAGGAVAAASFVSANTQTVATQARYSQKGRFAYRGAGPSAVYTAGQVTTGQPVYQSVVHTVDFIFTYRIVSSSSLAMSGETSLDAVVSEPDGWSRTVVLTAPSHFHGTTATVTGTLDLASIDALLSSLGNAVGATSTPGAMVTISPQVAVVGRIAGRPLSAKFAPQLPFTLDATEFSIGQPSAGTTGVVLTPVKSGVISIPETVSASFDLLGAHLPVRLARELGAGVFALGVLGAIALALAFRRAIRAPEADRIHARYRNLLVEAKPSSIATITAPVELASMEELARVADQEGCPILHWEDAGGKHRYLVTTGSISYSFGCRGDRSVDSKKSVDVVQG
ncbi:MAG: signal peptidase I [Ferrimicrobium sp.]